jgi:hypothetical protein
MIHSIRWLGPLVFTAAALVGAGAAAQGSDAAQPKDAQSPSDAAAAQQGGAPTENAAAEAKSDDFDRTPKDCITVTNIRETKVLDDSTILFYMRGSSKVTYRISLPQGSCPNLAREDRFSYKTTMNRLCSSDLITVLEQWGVGLREGFSCRLGLFYPIPYDEAELLRKEHDKPNSTRSGVKTKPAEVPPTSEAPPAASETTPQSRPAPAGEQAPASDSAPR